MFPLSDHHPPPPDTELVCVARVQDHLRGGEYSFSFDRECAEADPAAAGIVRGMLRDEHAFVHRAVQQMLDRGIRQFVDLGSGLPARGAALPVITRICPDVRVVHVDNDPAVVAHARMLFGDVRERECVVLADATRPDQVLVHCVAENLLDLRRPVGLLAIGLAHLLPASAGALSFLPSYGRALTAGSALALTHLAPGFPEPLTAEAISLIAGRGKPVHPRRKRKVTLMFGGFDLLDPGVFSLSDGDAAVLAGVGIKP
jgi:hypothetical protein